MVNYYSKSTRIAVIIIGILAGVSMTCAQSPTTYLFDFNSRQPIPFATLQCIPVTGNANITFATSDEQGRISACNCEGRDSIMWKVRHLSYLPVDTILSCQQTIDTILMYSKDYDIGEVIVSEKNEGVRVIGDSIRFDLSVFRKPHHRDLKDLLNDLPGIEVTEKGRVKYKGKEVGQILLSGKSTARNQFDMINRVVKKEDLSTVQLFPEDPEADQIDQEMTLDLVLNPNVTLLGQVHSRLNNQSEIEGSASVIRSGDMRWNHAAEVVFSQIADSHRPQLNFILEFYDNTNQFKKAINTIGQRPKFSTPLNPDLSEKDQVAYAFYNALYEDDRSEINLYARHSNHSSTRRFEQTNFNLNTSEPLWKESSIEEVNIHSSLFAMSWKYSARKNLTLRASSHIAHGNNTANQNGTIDLTPAVSRLSQWKNQYSNTNAALFAHALWQIDSSWTFQTGVQAGMNENPVKYDFGPDSMFYDIIVNPDPEDANLRYRLDRNVQNFDVGTSLQRKWNTLDQKTTWIASYNVTSMSDVSDPEEIVSDGGVFQMDQAYETHTATSFLEHKMKVSKIGLTNKLGGSLFQSDQVLTGNHRFRWYAQTVIRYHLKRDQSIFLRYSSNAHWLAESSLWRTARPINLQSYALAGNPDPAVIRNHNWVAGWDEFSRLKGNFSNAEIGYQYKPIHYEWRQKTRGSINVDTLVSERDFNEISIELRTTREILGVRISPSLYYSQSSSYGEALFTDQKLKNSNLIFRVDARDILQSEIIFIALHTQISRQTWQFGDQPSLPPQWNSKSTVQARWYIKRFNGWIASEVTYLWRGNIYDETLVSGSIEKKLGKHFMFSLGVENLFNLNTNVRRNRFISAELYRETEQTVFGGRVYFKVKYQL